MISLQVRSDPSLLTLITELIPIRCFKLASNRLRNRLPNYRHLMSIVCNEHVCNKLRRPDWPPYCISNRQFSIWIVVINNVVLITCLILIRVFFTRGSLRKHVKYFNPGPQRYVLYYWGQFSKYRTQNRRPWMRIDTNLPVHYNCDTKVL